MSIKLKVKQFRRSITYSEGFINFTASFAWFIIKIYFSTLKIKFYFDPGFLKLDRNRVLFGFWHGRQFLLVPPFGIWNITLMTDLSWAGEIQSRILSKFGYEIVRGSSKHKGAQALLMMKKSIEEGHPGGLALDGPSGPIYKSKPGIIFLAKKMGYPIIPIVSSAEKAWIIKNTWCNYLLPKPFSRCFVAMCRPIWINDDFSTDNLDRIVANLTKIADRKVGRK
ncbi:DUF374 domain-containing protein [bacterium]|nr:DUF374 domain-containing protein [bacterium]